MAAGDPILDVSDLINLGTGGGSGTPEQVNFYKSGLSAGAAIAPAPIVGRLHSMWRWDSTPGAATATPTTAVVTTNATDGALKQSTAGSGKKKRLTGVVACGLVAGTLVIYDRLVQHGGMSGNTATAQTTNLTGATTPTLTRHTSGVGVEIWLEIYTSIGSTGTTITCNYTDQAAAASTTQACTFGATNALENHRLLPLTLASGDTGVQTVTNADLLAATLTAGNFGITLAYPLVSLPLPSPGVGALFAPLLGPAGPIDLGTTSDACLALAWFANSVTPPQVFGSAYFLEK